MALEEENPPAIMLSAQISWGKEEGGWQGEGKEGPTTSPHTHQISTAAQVVKFYSSIVVAAAAVVVVVPFKSSCSLHVSLSLCSKVLSRTVRSVGMGFGHAQESNWAFHDMRDMASERELYSSKMPTFMGSKMYFQIEA